MKTLQNIPSNRSDYEFSYHFIERDKQSRQWVEKAMAKAAGDCCQSIAEKHFAEAGFIERDHKLQRLVDSERWLKLQTTQHLRQLKR